jgi:hypothetical protein
MNGFLPRPPTYRLAYAAFVLAVANLLSYPGAALLSAADAWVR